LAVAAVVGMVVSGAVVVVVAAGLEVVAAGVVVACVAAGVVVFVPQAMANSEMTTHRPMIRQIPLIRSPFFMKLSFLINIFAACIINLFIMFV
jgi:ABC-type uncharacterized transport system permease subunit